MFKTLVAPIAVLLSLTAGAAQATTLLESDLGDFSNSWQTPTAIGAGVTSVSGTWSGSNDYDIFSFKFLPVGQQTLTLIFDAIPGFGYSYSAGGSVLFSTSAFRWGWDGTAAAGGGVSFGYNNAGTPIQRTIELGDDFAGQLWLGLYGTHSNPLRYTISSSALPAPADAAPAVVPVPATLALMLTALGGLGVLALRRRKAAALAS
ncbi:PEP-CTERM sorting domain-containing protein [Pseudotabrizicola formosa]|uniref:PEP-CTERM sorting domain-containing protein n=1 Tax=Pseudotabrizicola formosa TaxID=2030009 RepID=UPI00143D8781|nr:PEP-CTERM sorting domain-containing protein [Pseudotabrizicola formosa]